MSELATDDDGDIDYHPASQTKLFGHDDAQHAFLSALAADRLPHAWLIGGPTGVGKATLAFAIARFMLSNGRHDMVNKAGQLLELKTDLATAFDPNVNSRIIARSHGDLLVVERGFDDKKQRERIEIPVDQIRRIIPFMQSTAAEGGWRVVIVDGADTMNRSAQNALLKGLEEPPNHTLLLLLADRPERLLPTVRSRCRSMALTPLADATMQLALKELFGFADSAESLSRMAGGCPGEALRIEQAGITTLWSEILDATGLEQSNQASGARGVKLRQAVATSVANDLTRWHYFGQLLRQWLHSQARIAVPGTPALDQPFAMWDKISHQMDECERRNLDRRLVALQILEQLRQAADSFQAH